MEGLFFAGLICGRLAAGPFARLDERACPAGGYFSMMKSSKRFLGRVCGRLAAGRRFCRVQSRYAYPAGAYFCMRASSRALLHVGSLSLWDRQPSNAPPLLLSPAGLASRRGPHTKTHLGLCPKTPLPLNCGWIRTMRSIVRTAPQIRSQGACGALYVG